MNITKNFTLEELTKSATADRLKINNEPAEQELNNLLVLCRNILQPIRDAYGKPIIISSGYRCAKLNKAVGGSKTSQHVKGEAADIHTTSDTKASNKALFELILDMVQKDKITVGQLINEYDYNWIHVSLPTKEHKNQIFNIK
jgi:uncharacterized protein YcbK (DUF882 family)